MEDVCRDLGVRHVLEGSVRKAGNRVRITAQLIDGTTGGHVWADRFDRDLDDIFAVQDEVTQAIVAALNVKLTGSRPAGTGTTSVEAYDLFLSGREQHHLYNPTGYRKARQLYAEAIALDPNYAAPYAGRRNHPCSPRLHTRFDGSVGRGGEPGAACRVAEPRPWYRPTGSQHRPPLQKTARVSTRRGAPLA